MKVQLRNLSFSNVVITINVDIVIFSGVECILTTFNTARESNVKNEDMSFKMIIKMTIMIIAIIKDIIRRGRKDWSSDSDVDKKETKDLSSPY